MGKVLGGLRVVEQGAFITGPAAAMLLGDLGADVVKVEHPETATHIARSREGYTARITRHTTGISAASRLIRRRRPTWHSSTN